MAYNTYLNRYDIEHFFRFGKQKLLLNAYQTQRSFANILEMIGTPAKSSVPRGNPKGRESGVKLEKRDTQPIHFKSAHQQNDLKKTISSPIENSQEKPNLNEIEPVSYTHLTLPTKRIV